MCGQCFRWSEDENGAFSGIAGGRSLTVTQSGDEVTLHGVSEQDIPFWENYFDLGTDYSAYIETLSADETLKKACEFSPGIRILRQEPFETLISFIISQNNNIKRIKGKRRLIVSITGICAVATSFIPNCFLQKI